MNGGARSRRRLLLGLLLGGGVFIVAGCAHGRPPPGEALKPGTVLVYQANGKSNPPWTVQAVEPLRVDGLSCARIAVSMAPGEAATERVRCTDGELFYAYDAAKEAASKLRPVAPNRALTLKKAEGEVRYETHGAKTARIGTREIPVVETTVTTVDASGRAVRRLREDFAPSLDAATEGTFEVPDGEGWRQELHFRLVELRG